MGTPFFDDATRDLFDEILAESVQEFRASKKTAPSDPAHTVTTVDTEDAWKRLHRSMYVMTMHRGRPHAERPAFQRRWLETAVQAIYQILATLPEEDTT